MCSIYFANEEELNRDYSLFYNDSIKHLQQLGRDKDPKTKKDISTFKVATRKAVWEILSLPGLRFMSNLIYPNSTISYLNRKNAVAFTIDDGFCGIDNPNGCMIDEVRALFKSYEANATFFISGSHCLHIDKITVNNLINDGHEIANHSMMDWPYNKYSLDEFLRDFNRTDDILSEYRKESPKWYRAPFGRINKIIQEVLDSKGMIHVATDAFANDTTIPDPDWISKFILKNVSDGSIILIHMPERNVREWNFEAMAMTLEGLKQKNYKVVNLTQLYNNDY